MELAERLKREVELDEALRCLAELGWRITGVWLADSDDNEGDLTVTVELRAMMPHNCSDTPL